MGWIEMFEFLGYACVMTNVALIWVMFDVM